MSPAPKYVKRCRTCRRPIFWSFALDEQRRADLIALLRRVDQMPHGPERRERMRNIVQDYGVTLRTAQRYLKEAREAA